MSANKGMTVAGGENLRDQPCSAVSKITWMPLGVRRLRRRQRSLSKCNISSNRLCEYLTLLLLSGKPKAVDGAFVSLRLLIQKN